MTSSMTMGREALFDSLGEEIVTDLVGEFSSRGWKDRRALVHRLLQVAQIASSLRAGDDAPAGQAERLVRRSLGTALSQVIERLGSDPVACDDQAYVYALSAAAVHRRDAYRWYAAHPRNGHAANDGLLLH